jgi:hypothetical protein
MADSKPFATDDTITVPIPADLAERFVRDESHRLPKDRSIKRLQIGTHDLGFWRIDGVASQANDGVPRLVAVLRRVLP